MKRAELLSDFGLGLAILAAACTPPAESQELRAFGTEPFWSVELGGEEVVLLDMAIDDTITYAAVEPLQAAGRMPDYARAYVLGVDPLAVLVVRRAEPPGCSDGMSDELYPYLALFLRGDRLYEGCAREAVGEGADASGALGGVAALGGDWRAPAASKRD